MKIMIYVISLSSVSAGHFETPWIMCRKPCLPGYLWESDLGTKSL